MSGGFGLNLNLVTPGSGGGCVVDGEEADLEFCQMLAAMGALAPAYVQDAKARVANASMLADEAFESSQTPHCSGLFNLPGGEDPSNLLTDPRLTITFAPLPPGVYAKTIGSTGSGSATIVINSGLASPFLADSPGGDANTPIHELLHAAVDIFGTGAVSPFWNNDDSTSIAQQQNNLLIELTCGSVLNQP